LDFALTERHATFLRQLRSFLSRPEVRRFETRDESAALEAEGDRAFFRMLYDAGYQGYGWPEEYGGHGGSAIEQWLYLEELSYRHLPRGDLTLSSVGPALIRFGTAEQKQRYLPRILTGEYDFAVGYSEPEAGSDLASLQTTAVREGDTYLVNGQKVYITSAHYASHIWLAARTSAELPRHRGISVLIVPVDAPGVTVREQRTQADGLTNEIFLDDVRVPVGNRVGEENDGWAVITSALDLERNFPYSGVARDFELLLAVCAEERDSRQLLNDDAVVDELVTLAADVEAARLLTMRVARLVDEGTPATAASSMSKVWVSELRERMTSAALSHLGDRAQLAVGEAEAPGGGVFEHIYRWSPMMKIGGGVNEVQRDVIARRGLGLTRGSR
jgi:alkylation response protein AidB-like acyl-CoA dehydrogenase